ncbi:MAG: YdeI family protein [Algoriphagus aquaeductus]|uniref:YdeI/OmpD-associated family protein n=1 Tax=Algoriphagus aquaeductus TaxID=475299 RepID=UPI003879D0B7
MMKIPMHQPNPQVDQFLLEGCMRCPKGATPACKVHRWTDILEFLRQLLLETELTEERKWGVPTYTLNGKNVIMLGVFNDSCVLSFLKGSLMQDPKGILDLPGPNSHEGRIIRFTELDQAENLEKELKAYILQAIEIEKSGKKLEKPEPSTQEIPEELIQKFEEHEGLEKAFFALTPGRQRGYLIHFTGAKQSATRLSRIEKCIPKIFEGKGMMD